MKFASLVVAISLTTSTLLAATAVGAEPRFARVEPAGATSVRVVVESPSNLAKLSLSTDLGPLAATFTLDAGLATTTVEFPPAATRLLLMVGGKAVGGVRLAPTAPSQPGVGWTIYQIMVGHFRNGNRSNDGEIDGWRHPNYAGGDLEGVRERAEYLQELGVDAVWLSPVFAANTSHGYDVRNYYRVGDAVGVPGDPVASLALLQATREALATRGIRTILDVPLNHASKSYNFDDGDPTGRKPRSAPARQEAEKLWDSWGAGYRYWNHNDPATRDFLVDVGRYWLVDQGFDGLRLDYVRGGPHELWAQLHRAVRQAKPNAWLVGEAWIDDASPARNAAELALYAADVPGVGPQFDALFDFPFQTTATNTFARQEPAWRLEETLQRGDATYGVGALFLDNHDVARFGAWNGDPRRLQAAVGFLAAQSNPIVLFYGTEVGLAHGAPKPGFTDAGRIAMPWDNLDQAQLVATRTILAARKAWPAMRLGGRWPITTDDQVVVMAKTLGDELVLVATNLGSTPRTITIPAAWRRPNFEPVLGTATPPSDADGGPDADGGITWTLPPEATIAIGSRRRD